MSNISLWGGKSMRSIQLVLRNLLVIFAVVVLFANVGRASPNEGAVKKCHKAVNGLLKEMSLKKTQTEFAALSQVQQEDVDQIVAKANDKADQMDKSQTISAGGVVDLSSYFGKCKALLTETCVLEKPDAKDAPEAQEQMKGFIETCYANTSRNTEQLVSTVALTGKFKQGMSTIAKVAIGAGVIGGGLLLKDHLDDKKDKKKEAKAAEEKKRAENGIIKDADGNDLVCFSEQNYLRVECSETMLGLCQAGKSTTAGCKAFNSNYCASSGSGTNYCLYADSRTYCSQSGSMIASSPACTWSASRSDECKKNPEQVSCLYSGSAESLTLACANYPSDPLCAANSAGRIVVQGGVAPTPNIDTANADTNTSTAQDYGDGASVTMSSVIGNGTTSTTSNSRGTADISSSTLASTESMFTSSSSVAAKACADGLLQNCSN
jgi:hypothetical protein